MSVFASLMLLQAAAAAPPPPQQIAALPNDEKVVCKTLVGTGSRLNTERICMTRKEWRKLAEGGEEETRRLQDQSSRGGPIQ
jgi:hypothetical protein